MDLIDVPLELVQIRAYVRWEEAGKPEGMPAEWQAAEFARALDDVRVELVEGTPLNEIRRKFNVMTVNNGEDDAPMKLPREVEEYKREREEMMRRAAAMGGGARALCPRRCGRGAGRLTSPRSIAS